MVIALLAFSTGKGQETGVMQVPASNLDVFRSLANRIAMSAIRGLGIQRPVAIRILPAESAWYIDSGIQSAFTEQQWSLTMPDSAEVIAEFGIRGGHTRYENIRRDGFLGEKIADRVVQFNMSLRFVDERTGTNLILSDFTESARDTIPVSSIESVENPSIPMTKGYRESEGVFSTLVEPVVLLGAIGVAVFLLFHVRS
ncbi:MAG: hypothetical protein ACKVRP_12315 [Bacteroidota bacterium]